MYIDYRSDGQQSTVNKDLFICSCRLEHQLNQESRHDLSSMSLVAQSDDDEVKMKMKAKEDPGQRRACVRAVLKGSPNRIESKRNETFTTTSGRRRQRGEKRRGITTESPASRRDGGGGARLVRGNSINRNTHAEDQRERSEASCAECRATRRRRHLTPSLSLQLLLSE